MNRERYGAHLVNQVIYGSSDRKIGNYSVLFVDLTGTIHSAADFANSNKNSAVASEYALPTSQKPVSVGKVSSSQSSSVDEESREIPRNQMNRESYGAHLVNQARYGSSDRKIGNYSVLFVDSTGTIHSAADFANSNKNSAVASEFALPTSQKPVSVGKVSSSQSSSADVLWQNKVNEITEKPISSLEKDPLSQGNRVIYQVIAKPSLSSVSDKTKPTPSQSSSQFFKPKDSPLSTVSDTEKRFSMLKKDIKSLIKKGIVPEVLKMPLSPSTYKDYFHALLYAEDCHLEKWEGFEVNNVILELHNATTYTRKRTTKSYSDATRKDLKVLVQFDIDKILQRQSRESKSRSYRKRERRPLLLSTDFVSVKPTGSNIKPFKGVIYHVVKSSLILVEFGESFQSQHVPGCEYDVKFSFNRFCLKRAHHAITAASDTLYRNFLFPGVAPKQEIPSINLFYRKEAFAVWQILKHQSAPPYLVEGPLSIVDMEYLSRTALVIVGAVLQICRKSPSNRVLLCAPLNNTCDELTKSLKTEMDESDIFRANSAFQEIDGVSENILPSCLYEEESDCYACPSLEELKKYKVISSTFMSSFRLRDEGMVAGHFSHIFLVDASSVIEPEAMVPLANFANSETVVVVTGAPRNRSGWVRSKIARQNGLMTSYFERLRESELYKNLDPRVIMQLDGLQKLKESSESLLQFLDHISLFLRI